MFYFNWRINNYSRKFFISILLGANRTFFNNYQSPFLIAFFYFVYTNEKEGEVFEVCGKKV